MNNSFLIKIILLSFTAFICSCKTPDTSALPISKGLQQVEVARINEMPDMPTPYKMKDWKQIAVDFDQYVYDFDQRGQYLPLIWIDSSKRNFSQNTFGIYTAIGDIREGPLVNNGENHEAIGALGSIFGATLVGIDKSNQHGYNFVEMSKNYFNQDNEWDVVMNFTSKKAHIGGGYGNDYWYDIYNNVLFYAMADFYPDVEGINEIQRKIADQFLASAKVLGDNYSYSFFDFSKMKGGTNHIPTQEDVAAGYAFVLYAAYVKYKDEKYLTGAKMALSALQKQKENRNYEMFMPFGAYMAARLNAEMGSNYDIMKFLNWTFDGNSVNRDGWGVLVGNWNGYDVSGIFGSTKDKGGYGFAMNTFDLAWPLVPMVRYDQRYATAIGKWMVNAANAARLFYPNDIPDSLQALPSKKAITRNVIAYEGLVKSADMKGFEGTSPFAQGDGPLWAPGMPDVTMFSIYGSGHVGIFGSIIRTTEVEGILMLDCLATDLYRKTEAYPTWLVYNPHNDKREVEIRLGDRSVDIYDAVNQKLIVRNVKGSYKISLMKHQASLLVYIPTQSKFTFEGAKLLANGVVVDYHYERVKVE